MSSEIQLSQFQCTPPKHIFKNAQKIPEFFKTQLLDPQRTIKILKNDPHSIQRIFSYQYLLLCTMQQGYPQIRTQNLRIILTSPQYSFIIPKKPLNPQLPLSDLVLKSLLMEFINELPNNLNNLNALLNKYPIIDQIMVLMMRSLLIMNGIVQQRQQGQCLCQQFVNKNDVVTALGRIFDVQFQEFGGGCGRFSEADVFVLEESAVSVYMVYLRSDNQSPGQTQSQSQPQQYKPPTQQTLKPVKKQKTEMYISMTNTQGYQFIDYTGLGIDRLNNPNLYQSVNQSPIDVGNVRGGGASMLSEPFKEVQMQAGNGEGEGQGQGEGEANAKEKGEVHDSGEEEPISSQSLKFPQLMNNDETCKSVPKIQNNIEQGYESDEQSNEQSDKPQQMNDNVQIQIVFHLKQRMPAASEKQQYQPIKIKIHEPKQDNLQIYDVQSQQAHQVPQQMTKQENKIILAQPAHQKQSKKMINPEQEKQFSFAGKSVQAQFQKTHDSTDNCMFMGNSSQENQSPSIGTPSFALMSNNYNAQTKIQPTLQSKALESLFMSTPIPNPPKQISTPPLTTSSSSPLCLPLSMQYSVKKSIPSYFDNLPSHTNKAYSHIQNTEMRVTTPNSHPHPHPHLNLNLNVTKQFTNSFVRNMMPEPHRQEIWRVRERARDYRRMFPKNGIL